MNKQPFFFQMAVKEVTTADNGAVRVRGYASTPNLDRYRDIVEPSAFEGALKTYMTNPVVLRSHDADRPVGLVESAKVTDKGLWVEAVIKEEKTAKEVNDGLFRTFSIGYIPLTTELRNKDNKPFDPMKDDPWDRMNIRVIKELDLVEISVVSTPANAGALFTLGKSFEAFGKALAFKAFNVSLKENIPANEVEPEDKEDEEVEEGEGEQTEEAKTTTDDEKKSEETKAEAGGSCTLADGSDGTWQAGEDGTLVCMPLDTSTGEDDEEKSVEDETEGGEADEEEAEDTDENAGEAAKTDDQTEEKSTEEKSQEDAENAGETTAAEGGEGGTATEAPSADAKPETEAEGDTEDKSEKAIIVTKDIADLFPNLKAVGALREPEGEEKGIEVPKAWIGLMRKLHDALVSENERANTEQKRATDLQKVLDTTPNKKAIAMHSQFGTEDTSDKKDAKSTEPSDFIKKLFKL